MTYLKGRWVLVRNTSLFQKFLSHEGRLVSVTLCLSSLFCSFHHRVVGVAYLVGKSGKTAVGVFLSFALFIFFWGDAVLIQDSGMLQQSSLCRSGVWVEGVAHLPLKLSCVFQLGLSQSQSWYLISHLSYSWFQFLICFRAWRQKGRACYSFIVFPHPWNFNSGIKGYFYFFVALFLSKTNLSQRNFKKSVKARFFQAMIFMGILASFLVYLSQLSFN